MASPAQYFAKPTEASRFAKVLLEKAGLPEDEAALMADCLVQADTRGVVSGSPRPENLALLTRATYPEGRDH